MCLNKQNRVNGYRQLFTRLSKLERSVYKLRQNKVEKIENKSGSDMDDEPLSKPASKPSKKRVAKLEKIEQENENQSNIKSSESECLSFNINKS